MLNDTMHAHLVDLAGPRFDYDGVRGTSRPAADVRKELRLDLIARQGGICPLCGNGLVHPQFNHVVSRGPKVLGFTPLNVFAGCATCNLNCAAVYGTWNDEGMLLDGGIIPVSAFARPDLVPAEWTPFPILRDRNRAAKA